MIRGCCPGIRRGPWGRVVVAVMREGGGGERRMVVMIRGW